MVITIMLLLLALCQLLAVALEYDKAINHKAHSLRHKIIRALNQWMMEGAADGA